MPLSVLALPQPLLVMRTLLPQTKPPKTRLPRAKRLTPKRRRTKRHRTNRQRPNLPLRRLPPVTFRCGGVCLVSQGATLGLPKVLLPQVRSLRPPRRVLRVRRHLPLQHLPLRRLRPRAQLRPKPPNRRHLNRLQQLPLPQWLVRPVLVPRAPESQQPPRRTSLLVPVSPRANSAMFRSGEVCLARQGETPGRQRASLPLQLQRVHHLRRLLRPHQPPLRHRWTRSRAPISRVPKSLLRRTPPRVRPSRLLPHRPPLVQP